MTPSSLIHSGLPDHLQEVETFSKPGTADVTAGDRKKLSGILKHYAASAHPFTDCVRDQKKNDPSISDDHANRRCAVIKALIGRSTPSVKEADHEVAVEVLAEALDVVQLAMVGLGPRSVASILNEAKLDTKTRDALPTSDFAVPEKREYPIHDLGHARAALSLSSGKPVESRVRAAVKKRYPKVGEELLVEAEATEPWIQELCTAAKLIEAAPQWMIPVAARKPGFRPLSPEKRSTSGGTGSSAFNASKHPRGAKGSPTGGKFIRSGSAGNEVTAIQSRLNLARTGTYGGKTKRAVEAFQKRKGLVVDGIVGAQTVAAMRGNLSVKPGALNRNDRRFLRRYARRH